MGGSAARTVASIKVRAVCRKLTYLRDIPHMRGKVQAVIACDISCRWRRLGLRGSCVSNQQNHQDTSHVFSFGEQPDPGTNRTPYQNPLSGDSFKTNPLSGRVNVGDGA